MPERVAGIGTAGPLAGLGVVVTRPAHQAMELAVRLEADGARVLRYPLLAIDGPTPGSPVFARIASLAEYRLAIFVSVNAVTGLLALLPPGGGLPRELRLAAVGAATAGALRAAGYAVSVVPGERYDSESLLESQALQAQAVAGQRVLIVRGEGGRELLAETLRLRGARVEYAEVYRRVPSAADPEILHAALRAEWIHALIVTSSEAFGRLSEDLPAGELRERLLDCALVLLSPRTAALARTRGWRGPILVAEQASDRAVAECLRAWWQTGAA